MEDDMKKTCPETLKSQYESSELTSMNQLSDSIDSSFTYLTHILPRFDLFWKCSAHLDLNQIVFALKTIATVSDMGRDRRRP